MRVIDSQEPPAQPAAAFEIRRRSFDALVLRLLADDQAFFAALEDRLRQAPNFFRDTAVVLDLAEVAAANIGIDLIRVARQLRSRSLTPIGVQNGNAALIAAAKGAGLAILDDGREAGDAPAPQAEPDPEPAGSMLITEPVRSGQQVFCDHGDIVVTASVGSGAELIAAGNIHVYGALRGRALAGVNGDARARVFCHSLEAELVAIAGLYRVSDDIDRAVWRRPVQAFLEKDALRIEPQK
jgi:septum site-determining protein MinC